MEEIRGTCRYCIHCGGENDSKCSHEGRCLLHIFTCDNEKYRCPFYNRNLKCEKCNLVGHERRSCGARMPCTRCGMYHSETYAGFCYDNILKCVECNKVHCCHCHGTIYHYAGACPLVLT